MAVDTHRPRGRGSTLGYSIVLLGAALFVTSCFLPYYGFPQGQTVSLYDQLLVTRNGGFELGAKLFLFGGVATVVVIALIGLIRGERQSGRGFLAGAVSAWSLTWIGSLLQSAGLRGRHVHRRAVIGGRLLAAGREYRRSGHRNDPGREANGREDICTVRRASNRGMAPA